MSASDQPTPNSGNSSSADSEPDVMAALDKDALVIADVSREDAWLTVPASEAPNLTDWR